LRKFLVIVRYELLMQVKCLRYIGMCILAGLLCFSMYQYGALRQQIDLAGTILGFEFLPVYLVATVMAGLSAEERARGTGFFRSS